MTIKRAREIFGEEIDCLNDEQILALIQKTSMMCDKIMDLILTKDLTVSKKEDYHED